MLRRAPDALRADFQHYYKLDLDDLGGIIRVGRAADLAANMPPQAITWARLDPRMAWDTRTQLLALIANNTGFTAWSRSAEAAKRGAKWHSPIKPPWEQTKQESIKHLSRAELDHILSMPRK